MFDERTYEELRLLPNIVWVDVRSPGEFQDAAILNAVNMPLFSDEERIEVGTAYKQVSPARAKEIGIQLVSPKIPDLMKEVKKISTTHHPVIYCSRGGMRSQTMATLADLAGISVSKLQGGYRAYRSFVVENLSTYKLASRLVILHGLTGVGKTDIIQALVSMQEPAIDLEAMAGHRGSAFGGFGLSPKNQKSFDSEFLAQISQWENSLYLIMEAESKRIGRVQLPDFLLAKRTDAIHILLHTTMDVRVKRTLSNYVMDSQDFAEEVKQAIKSIEKRLAVNQLEKLWQDCMQKRWEEVCETLLHLYYDPLYQYSINQYQTSFVELDATDITSCAIKIRDLLHSKFALN